MPSNDGKLSKSFSHFTLTQVHKNGNMRHIKSENIVTGTRIQNQSLQMKDRHNK